MAISSKEIKLLWGKAAGICTNPGCRADLTDSESSQIVGEMAHIIAKSGSGPRGNPEKGDDSYSNLILLCSGCHTKIDKSPELYSVEILRTWKVDHEMHVRKGKGSEKLKDIQDLKKRITLLLQENHGLWRQYGPSSDLAKDPGSNAHTLWTYRKLDKILPNNRAIINLVRANLDLLSGNLYQVFLKFENHAEAFEQHQYEILEDYPRFPVQFSEVFNAKW